MKLARRKPGEVTARRGALDPEALERVRPIVEDVRQRGEPALREWAEQLGDLESGAPLVLDGKLLEQAPAALPGEQRELLERTARRIEAFARMQRSCLRTGAMPVPGGMAGHDIEPVKRAGCYAPGGRFPLPSSVLMTAVTARVAGVDEVWVASPRPTEVTVAAAAIAGADGLLCAGGAQAIAALAYGAGPVPACDVVAGPGNAYVTAAKYLVSEHVGIDMLAGPSELVVLADAQAEPALVAADLLAQAEHDEQALPVLVSLDEKLVAAVEAELDAQLADLPTAATARAALDGGFAVVCGSRSEAIATCDALAPEHLAIHMSDAEIAAMRLGHYGALFVGSGATEVLGDYGVGPNHVLPTGGGARHTGGLSVFTFLRLRTWLRGGAPDPGVLADAEALARLEGLEAHARSAHLRLTRKELL